MKYLGQSQHHHIQFAALISLCMSLSDIERALRPQRCHSSLHTLSLFSQGRKVTAEIKRAAITEGVLVPAVSHSNNQISHPSLPKRRPHSLQHTHTRRICNQTATSSFLTSADVSNCRLKQVWKANSAWIQCLPKRLAHCLIGSWRTDIQMHPYILLSPLPSKTSDDKQNICFIFAYNR